MKKQGISINAVTAILLGLTAFISVKYIHDGKMAAEETLKIRVEENSILEVALIQCRNESDFVSDLLKNQTKTNLRHHVNNSAVANETKEINNKLKEKYDEEKKKLIKYLATHLRDSPYPGVENYTRYAVARLGMVPIENVKPLIPEFGPVVNDVLSFRYPINIPSCPPASAAVTETNTRANPSVFIALISAPGHFKERNDIRETWHVHLKSALAKNLLGMARFAFFLGQTKNDSIQKRIGEESQKHGDIVQIDMDDSYRNLTLKGIAVLNWVRQHCPKVDLVFKVDDDVYVNVHNLVHFVRSNRQSNNSLFGYGNFGFYPIRMELGYPEGYAKWDMTFEEYPWSHFPNYVNGPAYFMHASVVIQLLAASQTTPLIPFEDVFLTGMCTEKAGVKTQYSEGNPRFLFYIYHSINPSIHQYSLSQNDH